MAAPDPSTSDFVKVGFDKVNFFVMFPTFTAAFTIPGILGGVAAFYHKSSAVQKVELVADYSLGPLYVAMFLVRIIFSFIQSNLADARRNTGINVPDQHAYKVVTGSAAGSLVLMDDEGAFGRFNRAQRGVQNVWENVFPLSIELLVFPGRSPACCASRMLRARPPSATQEGPDGPDLQQYGLQHLRRQHRRPHARHWRLCHSPGAGQMSSAWLTRRFRCPICLLEPRGFEPKILVLGSPASVC
ncbi:unnamed protein product [Effrenium voratum]|nr:unnamed protein product [Effrenium voratum]